MTSFDEIPPGVSASKRLRLPTCWLALGVACCTPVAPSAKQQVAAAVVKEPVCTLQGEGAAPLLPLSRSSSSVALARSGKETLAFVADEDTERIVVVPLGDAAPREEVSLALSGAPSALLVTSGGYLAAAVPSRAVIEIASFDGKQLSKSCSIPVPSDPSSMALTEDGRTLLLSSAWAGTLTAFSTDNLAEQYRVPLARDPRAIALDDSTGRAFVTHGVGGVLSVVDLATRRSREVSLNAPLAADMEAQKQILRDSFASLLAQSSGEQRASFEASLNEQLAQLERPARFGNQGFALALSVAPAGRVFVPQVEVDSGTPTQRTRGYGSEFAAAATPAVAVVDQDTLVPVEISIQAPEAWVNPGIIAGREACRLPRAAVADAGSGLLLVACLGADTLVGYDAAAPNPIDAEVLRVPLGAGPTGLALDGAERRAVVWSQFERVLTIVPLPGADALLLAEAPEPTRIALEERPLTKSAAWTLGRRLFNTTDDPRIAQDGRACASCHIGGRDDGLVWSTPHGPRRTKMLGAFLNASAPFSWDGGAKTLHEQLTSTFDRLQGAGGLRSVERDALLAYIAALPAPVRGVERPDDAIVQRGAALFQSQETGCASCHGGDAGTDNASHDVKSSVSADVTQSFDTPVLRFLEGRAPYFHDGRYTSLKDLLTHSDGVMGNTKHLSERDSEALLAYLGTL